MIIAARRYGLRELMPMLAMNEGIWEGSYRHFDRAGTLVDQHQVRSVCRIPDVDPYPYYQTNYYSWHDGRADQREFPAWFSDGRLVWSNDLLSGWVLKTSNSRASHTTLFCWRRTDLPEMYAIESVRFSARGTFRSRLWRWYHRGILVQRTAVRETKVSQSWQH